MMFNCLYLALFINLLIGIYLFKCFLSQKRKNYTTFIWAIAFVLIASAQGLYNFLKIPSPLVFIISSLGLILLLAGVLLYLVRRPLVLYGVPIILFLGSLVLNLLALKGMISLKTEMWLLASLIVVPITFFLSFLFAMLYAVLSYARDGYKSQLGPLLISIGFALDGILFVFAPVIHESPFKNYWYLLRCLDRILLLVGIYLMYKETPKLIALKRRIHGLSELKE